MLYQGAKKYLLAIAFTAVLVVLSGFAGGSIVNAEESNYRGGYQQHAGYVTTQYRPYDEWRYRRDRDRHWRHERWEWRRHHRGYYDRYGYFHRYGY